MNDYLSQLRQMKKMGGMEGVLSMLPGVSKIKKQMNNANIDENVILNEKVKIFPNCYVGKNTSVGSNTIIYPGVKIYPNTVIGNNCTIHSNSVIGSDGFGFAPQENEEFITIPQIGNVIIKDNVNIGSNTVIDKATIESTIINEGVKLDNLIQIGHNVEIGKNTVIAAQSGISGSTKVGKNSMLGGQVGVVGHLKLGDFSKYAAQAGVSKNTKNNQTVIGSPAMPKDQFIKSYGRTYGIKIIIAHPCNNYGPNQHPEKFIPKMIFNILNNKSLPVYGNGKNVREWMYVKDSCEALLKIFLRGQVGRNYNVGTGVKLRNIDIIKKLLDAAKKNKIIITKKNKIDFVTDRPGHDERYALNSNRIKREIKWKHKVSISKGLENTFDWYRNNLGYFKKISKKDIAKRLGLKL